tara:strand:- start:9 stop:425 length:417 start_codon:yes stop_codon:yes gene_type:complete
MKTFEELRESARPGLWANIHARRKSGKRMRKKGEKGAPALDAFDKIRKSESVEEKKKLTGRDSKGHFRATEKGAGMTAKGVRAARRENPGSKLQTAVTTPPSKLDPNSKAAKRRKSFCARSRGWTGERGKAARRRWNC